MISERQAADPDKRKPSRACELCLQERANCYCAADDAFLCHACDASVHSANHVANKHERVSLRTVEISDGVVQGAPPIPKWHRGFKRKARTKRIHCAKRPLPLQSQDSKNERRGSIRGHVEPRVPEIGEEGMPLRTNKNAEDSNSLVPDSHASKDAKLFSTHDDEDDYLAGIPGDTGSLLEAEKLGEKAPYINIEEMSIEFDFEYENDSLQRYFGEGNKTKEEEFVSSINRKLYHDESLMGYEIVDDKILLVTPKTDEDIECKTSARHNNMFLRLNYEDVMAAWNNHDCTWTIGSQTELTASDYQLASPGICWWPTEDKVGGGAEKKGSCCSERQARVWRYRDKRRTRLFKKKIRYEVRKLNAEKRPRIKGRFVRRSSLDGNP